MQVYRPVSIRKARWHPSSSATLATIRAVLWDDKAKIALELKDGDAVRLRNVYSKANMSQEPEVHVGKVFRGHRRLVNPSPRGGDKRGFDRRRRG